MIMANHPFRQRSLNVLDENGNEGCAFCGRPRSVHPAPGCTVCADPSVTSPHGVPVTTATPGRAHPLDVPAMAALAVYMETDALGAALVFHGTLPVRERWRAIADAAVTAAAQERPTPDEARDALTTLLADWRKTADSLKDRRGVGDVRERNTLEVVIRQVETALAAQERPAPELAARSFEDMLADPHEQFDLRSELLASIAEYAAAPQSSASTYPSPQPVPELAAAPRSRVDWARVSEAVADRERERDEVRTERDRLRGQLDKARAEISELARAVVVTADRDDLAERCDKLRNLLDEATKIALACRYGALNREQRARTGAIREEGGLPAVDQFSHLEDQ